MKMRKTHRIVRPVLVGLTVLCSSVSVTTLSASTLVHWRFEEGAAGSNVDHTSGAAVFDSSGNGNHMRTFADFTAPGYVSDTPFGTVPQTGQPNNRALDFSPNQDIYSEGMAINAQQFSEWTIELSFKANVTNAWQVIMGKDGQALQPNGVDLHGASPFFLKTIADNGHLELGMVDGIREFRSVLSDDPLQAGQWYSVAATATATELSFWMTGPGDSVYVLQGTMGIDGAFTSPSDYVNPADYNGNWTLGRGMWGGGITDWFDGAVDEVRISDVALDSGEFLAAIPEPSTYALFGGAGALALVFLRRRRGAVFLSSSLPNSK